MEYISEPIENYQKLVIENFEYVSTVERFLSFAQYAIPNRYSENELQTELYNFALTSVTCFHDYLWTKAAGLVKEQQLTYQPSKRVLKSLKKSKTIPEENFFLTSLFSLITNSESLIELIMIHYYSNDKESSSRWKAVVWIEIVKVLVQLKMLWNSRGSVLVFRHFPQRPPPGQAGGDLDDDDDDDESSKEEDLNLEEILNTGHNTMTGERWTLYDANRLHQQNEIRKREKSTEPTPTSLKIFLGEFLWIIRPLIYLKLLFRNGHRSWRPWFFSLLIELASWKLQQSSYSQFNGMEKEELGRRRFLWVLYLVRAPGPLLKYLRWLTTSPFASLPLVGRFAVFLINLLQIVKQRYFFTAGSS